MRELSFVYQDFSLLGRIRSGFDDRQGRLSHPLSHPLSHHGLRFIFYLKSEEYAFLFLFA
jgi:hypothetical protein